MTDKRPEALRLADELTFHGRYGTENETQAATRRVKRNAEAAALLRQWPEAPSQQPAPERNEWRTAIDDELVCAHIGTTDSFPDARTALKAVIAWNVQVALDPAVSSDAQALIDRGASQAAQSGMVMVPEYRGYAALGTGQYILDISADANPAELIIHVATEEEKEGRTVGDLRDKPNPGNEIPPEKMAVRLAFFTVAGLDALEQQLRILRETHFAAAPQAVPPPQPLTGADIIGLMPDYDRYVTLGQLMDFARRVEAAVLGITAKGEQ
jgi:hypothetical protein